MASVAGFKGMVAASWLMDAIKALRRVPGTRHLPMPRDYRVPPVSHSRTRDQATPRAPSPRGIPNASYFGSGSFGVIQSRSDSARMRLFTE